MLFQSLAHVQIRYPVMMLTKVNAGEIPMEGPPAKGKVNWPSILMWVIAQWPLCAVFLGQGKEGYTSSTWIALALTFVGLWLAWVGRRVRFAGAALPLAALFLSAGAFIALRNAPLSVFLALAAALWLITAIAVVAIKPTVTKLALLLTAFFAVALLAEALVGRINLVRGGRGTQITGGTLRGQVEIPDREAMAQLLPMGSAVARKVRGDGVLDFEAHYHTDRFASRVVPGRPETGPAWYLFGCSATFGEGLEDDQTFAAQLQKLNPAARVFNFGIRNTGTSDAWIHLKRKLAAGEAPQWCVYFFMDDHFRRTGLPDLTVATQGIRPRVVLRNGRPVFLGKAEDTIGSSLDQFRINMVRRSRVFSTLRSNWAPTEETVELVASLIQAMQDESRTANVQFLAVILPFNTTRWTRQVAQLDDRLRHRGVPVLNMDGPLQDYLHKNNREMPQLFFADGHPRAEYAVIVAQQVSDYIARQASATQPATAP